MLLRLCCATEAKIKKSGRGIAVRGGLDENSSLIGAVPGPDFFTEVVAKLALEAKLDGF